MNLTWTGTCPICESAVPRRHMICSKPCWDHASAWQRIRAFTAVLVLFMRQCLPAWVKR